MQCESIITQDDKYKKLIQNIDSFLIEFHLPEVFDIRNKRNALNRHDETFENICASLESNGTTNASEMATFSFYARIKYHQKRNEQMSKVKN